MLITLKLEILEFCLYAEIQTWRERESEMNHAEAVQNEKILIGAFAYQAVGERSALDRLVLCWPYCFALGLL